MKKRRLTCLRAELSCRLACAMTERRALSSRLDIRGSYSTYDLILFLHTHILYTYCTLAVHHQVHYDGTASPATSRQNLQMQTD
jgi:hypothetical protein